MSRVFKGETAPNVSEEGESVGAKAGHRSALDKEVRPGGARGQGWRRVVRPAPGWPAPSERRCSDIRAHLPAPEPGNY